MYFPSVKCVSLNKKSDNSNQLIINNCNFSLSGNGLTAIIGPSGAGKTSLLYCLSGIDEPSSGKVIINDNDIYSFKRNMRSKYLRENIGFIFQNYNLIPYLTVKENILLSQKLANKKILEADFNRTLLDLGIRELKDTRVSQLSGGEQQRVAISRAVLMESNIILADEPTGALDSNNTNKVLDYLEHLSQNGTLVIMVTHDIAAASRADNLIFMKDGKILELTGKMSENDILSKIS